MIVIIVLISFMVFYSAFPRNITSIHITGWPQSGTSLLHQIVGRMGSIGTVQEYCDINVGSSNCERFNYEGILNR